MLEALYVVVWAAAAASAVMVFWQQAEFWRTPLCVTQRVPHRHTAFLVVFMKSVQVPLETIEGPWETAKESYVVVEEYD